MDTKTGEIREIQAPDKPKSTEIEISRVHQRELGRRVAKDRLSYYKDVKKVAVAKRKAELGRKLTASEMKTLCVNLLK